MKREHRIDVAVIGAGLAGLSAARDLEEAGVSTLVLEARDRVGGRTLNADLGGGFVAELGGQFVGPAQDAILDLAADLGIDTYPTFDEGEALFEYRDRVERHTGPDPSPIVGPDGPSAQACMELDSAAREIPAEDPWTAAEAQQLDGMTVDTWLRKEVDDDLARRYLEVLIEGFWAMSPREISMLHLLFYINAVGGLHQLTGIEGGALEGRLVGGAQAVSIGAASALASAPLLGAAVRAIVRDSRGLRIEADGHRVLCDQAVVAVPPPLAGRIEYEPVMPPRREQLTQRMPQGATVKCLAVYERPIWREDGLSGRALSLDGPVTYTYDSTPPGAEFGVLVCFVCGSAAVELGSLDLAGREQVVVSSLTRLFGAGAGPPARYVDHCWAGDRWSGGAYFANFQTGGWTGFGSALRAPVGDIHWAGTELATRWPGHMDGAVRSGAETAAAIVGARRSV